MRELPTRAAFEECRGTKFRVDAGASGLVEFELIEVKVLRPTSDVNGRPFALLFRGPSGQVLAQRVYPMEHDRLGALAVFVVPVGQDAAEVRYEAVFN